jgi:predicted AAA+ superfamily ATPase
MEKSEIIEILNEWNYWDREVPPTIRREKYDKKIAQYIEKDEVLVIKGVRRCGKSTLMLGQIRALHQRGIPKNEILFVNLEDPRFINHLSLELFELIKESYLEYLNPKGKPYIFLDEVQTIPNWEKWVNKEVELKQSFMTITGSNSSLLSSEIASVLTGRYISVDIYPLGFGEFLVFNGIEVGSKMDLITQKIELNRALSRYLKEGGFPRLVDYPPSQKKELLISYKNAILLKDIVARFRLKNFLILNDIVAFLLANTGIIQSISKLKNNFSISHSMAKDYIDYLKKAYLIFEITKFDYSLKKQRVNDKKYYSVDLGLSNLMRVPNREFVGADLESVVFLELIRRGYKVYYYKTKGDLEIDFVVEEDNRITQLIQVSKTLKDQKTKKRELAPFKKAKEELYLNGVECLVISEDSSALLEDGVVLVNIKEYLIFGF